MQRAAPANWRGDADEQAAARAAGLQADRGRIMVDALSREAELEEVTDALVLTPNDDFNALVDRAVESEHLAPGARWRDPERSRRARGQPLARGKGGSDAFRRSAACRRRRQRADRDPQK